MGNYLHSIIEMFKRLRIHPSSWMLIHFWSPLLPFFLITIFRLLYSPSSEYIYKLNFLEISDLALSISVLGLFASQSILKADSGITDAEFLESRKETAQNFKNVFFIFFFFFVATEVVEHFIEQWSLSVDVNTIFWQILILFWTINTYRKLDSAQKHFKLEAEI